MDIVVNFLFALLLMSLAGSVLFLIWLIFRRLFENFCDTSVMYYGIRIVLLALLIPVMYIGLFFNTVDILTGEMEGSHFLITRSMRNWAAVFGIIWLTGAVVRLSPYVYREFIWHKIRKWEIEADSEWVELLEECKKKMGIRRRVKLYMLEAIFTSFTNGSCNPAIWLPTGFERSDYEMMLCHELIHVCHRDIFWGRCLMIAHVLHWFNPIMKHLIRWMSEWEEYYADQGSAVYVPDREAYCNLLLSQSQGAERKMKDYGNSLFFAKTNTIKERIKRMLRKEADRKLRMFSRMAALCFLVIGALGVGCITSLAAEARNEWFFNTMEIEEEENIPFENTLEERSFDASELEGYTFEEEESSEAVPLGAQSFTWTVGRKTTKLSGGFTVTAGGSIYISVSVAPENKEVRVGIQKPDGTYTTVTGSGRIVHTFSAAQTGTYKFVVINDNSSSVDVEGAYTY